MFGFDIRIILALLNEVRSWRAVYSSLFITYYSQWQIWKQNKCPLMSEWLKNNILYIYSGILFSYKKEIMPFAITWIHLKDVMLSEKLTLVGLKNPAALFIIENIWKQKTKSCECINQSSLSKQKRTVNPPAIKRSKLMINSLIINSTTWVNLKNITLSNSDTKEDTLHNSIYWSSRKAKLIICQADQ